MAGIISLACTVQAALLFPEIANGQVLRQEIAWLPSLGLDFVVRMDGFAWMFSMLVLGIGTLVVLYARYYMSPADPVPRFFSFLLAFMGAMMGVVLSGNVLQLAFFWELTSIFSFLLIGYWHHRQDARRGARMALTVTGTGGLCLLAGLLMLGSMVGSYDLDAILQAGASIHQHPLYTPMLVLVLLGALSKSAQFPFHFWLPHAMAAPTPVSSYLSLGHHGQSRGVFNGAAVACSQWHRRMVLDCQQRRRGHLAAGRVCRLVSKRPQGAAGLLHPSPTWG